MLVERIAAVLHQTDDRSRRAFFSLAAGLAGLVRLDQSEASKHGRRRKRKTRCRKRGQTCTNGGKRRCCHGRTCDVAGPDGLGPPRCCQPNLGLCQEDRDCCGVSACVDDGAGPRCLLILQP